MRSTKLIALATGLLAASALFTQAQTPRIGSLGQEEIVSGDFMERPSISTDSKAQPHFVADCGGDPRFMKFHKVNGQWAGGIFAVGSRGGRYSASRLYVGQIEVDPLDRAWISCKFGVKEYGSMYGQGVWLFNNVAKTAYPPEQFFRFVVTYKGMGMVATDSKYPNQGVVLGTFGNFRKLDASGNVIGSGTMNAGHGGEKVRFRIASYAPRFGATKATYADGIWHTVMNGYSALAAKYQNNKLYEAGQGPISWASNNRYPEMGNDLSHPGIGIDSSDPRVAYMGCVFEGNVCVNVWDGEKMTAKTDNLAILGSGAAREVRHGPAFAPAPGPAGGSFVFWTSGGIKMGYISKKGVVAGTLLVNGKEVRTPIHVASGRSPGATTDRFGNVHLVYYSGGIRYRKITVASLEPIAPKGRIANTRTPRFRWSNTQAAQYTLEITRDGQKFAGPSVAATSWTPKEDLGAGVYRWRVKEGGTASTKPWSPRAEFSIPPRTPDKGGPAGRFPDAPTTPEFEWINNDADANQFRIQLLKGGEWVGDEMTDGADKNGGLSLLWPDALGAGFYQWRMRAIRLNDNPAFNVASDWTPLMHFQVGVPGLPEIVDPAPKAEFAPGPNDIFASWTEAEGADTHKVKVLFNGKLLFKSVAIDGTEALLSRFYQPGRYKLLAMGQNGHGAGPWSAPSDFTVRRNMRPDNDVRLTDAPHKLVWTRNKDAKRYLAQLAVYDSQTEKYKVVRRAWVGQAPFGQLPAWKPNFRYPTGSYRWSVTDFDKAGKSGYTQFAFFQIRLPGRPAIVTPEPGSDKLGQIDLPFEWQDPSGAALEFQLQIWQGGTRLFQSFWQAAGDVQKVVAGFQFLRSFGGDGAENLTWRVRGRNKAGVSPWRSASPFSVAPLAKPTLLSPPNGYNTSVGEVVALEWGEIDKAKALDVSIQRGENAPEITELTEAFADGVPWTPLESGTYTIKVRSKADGCSEWSDAVTVNVADVPI